MKITRSYWLDLAAKLLAVSSAIYFFSYVTTDPDLWGHIKFGEDLWREKALPQSDPYSFTTDGHPWINHEWITELVFYLTYRYLGDAGLLFGKLGIGLAIVALLWKMCALRKIYPLAYGAVMVIAIAVMSPGFMIRPQVFSFLLFTLFLYVLHLYLQKGKNRLFLLPAFMVLWVNLHGGFLIGLALMVTVIGWKTVVRLTGRKADVDLWPLWLWLVMTGAATLVNPYGYKLLVFLQKSLSVQRPIGEWNPISLWDLSFPHLKLLMILFVATLLRKPKTWEGWEVVGSAVMLVASLLHQRHMPFFAIMVTPYLVYRLSTSIVNIEDRVPKVRLTSVSRNVLAVLVAVLVAVQVYQGVRRYVGPHCRIIVDPDTYPVSAVRFLKMNRIEGNLLLPFDWGEYAIWKLYPACKVSIDGRFRTVYPEPVIKDHFISSHDTTRWRTLIEKYPADLLLVRQIPFFQTLIKEQGPWVYVYSDAIALAFLRDSEKNREALERFRAGKFEYPTAAPSPYFP